MIKVICSTNFICATVTLALVGLQWIPVQQNDTEDAESYASKEAEAKTKTEECREAQLRKAKRFKSENDAYYFLSPVPIFYCDQMHNLPPEELADSLDSIGRKNWHETPEEAIFKQFQNDYGRGILSRNNLTQITASFENEQQYRLAHLSKHLAKVVCDPSTPPYRVLRAIPKSGQTKDRSFTKRFLVEDSKISFTDAEYEQAEKRLTTLKPPRRDRLAKTITESALARAQQRIAAKDYEQAANLLRLAEIRYTLSGQTGTFERGGVLDARCKMIECADLNNAQQSIHSACRYIEGDGLKMALLRARLRKVVKTRYESELNQLDALLTALKTQTSKQIGAQEITPDGEYRAQLDTILNRVRALARYRSTLLFVHRPELYTNSGVSALDLLERESGLALQERIYQLTKLVPPPEQHLLAYWSLVFELPALTNQGSGASRPDGEVSFKNGGPAQVAAVD
ncbi:MAG: hypothetical protein IPK73_26325 [Candidatus Obscuribacter sp.]|nr:hypothetical protein [Candidatus Obscuribacter sp.]MBK9277643.1 hypothetical protein [Candidatus Obscuribacter sp.]